MKGLRIVFGAALAASLLALLAAGATAPPEPSELPERLSGSLAGTDLPPGAANRIAVTLERWSTATERKSAMEALRGGGSAGLIGAIRKSDVGYLQLSESQGWRLRYATSFTSERGQIIRLATDKPILLGKGAPSFSADYPIGFIEFVFPPEGSAKGTLLAASQVRFDEKGNLEIQSLPEKAGLITISGIQRETLKRKPKGTGK